MKNLVLIFGLIVMTLSDTNAMRTVSRELDNHVPFLLVKVPTDPPIEILNLPSEQKVIFDGKLTDKSINLQLESYKGIPMRAPLVLRYDMDDFTFLDNVYAAFGRACQYKIDSIKKNALSRIFGV